MDSSKSVDLASSLNDAASSCYRKSLFGSTSNFEEDIHSRHSLAGQGWLVLVVSEIHGTEGYDGRVYDFLLNLPTMHYCNCLAILHRQPAADGFCPAFTDALLRSIMGQEGWHGTTAEVFSRVQA